MVARPWSKEFEQLNQANSIAETRVLVCDLCSDEILFLVSFGFLSNQSQLSAPLKLTARPISIDFKSYLTTGLWHRCDEGFLHSIRSRFSIGSSRRKRTTTNLTLLRSAWSLVFVLDNSNIDRFQCYRLLRRETAAVFKPSTMSCVMFWKRIFFSSCSSKCSHIWKVCFIKEMIRNRVWGNSLRKGFNALKYTVQLGYKTHLWDESFCCKFQKLPAQRRCLNAYILLCKTNVIVWLLKDTSRFACQWWWWWGCALAPESAESVCGKSTGTGIWTVNKFCAKIK